MTSDDSSGDSTEPEQIDFGILETMETKAESLDEPACSHTAEGEDALADAPMQRPAALEQLDDLESLFKVNA